MTPQSIIGKEGFGAARTFEVSFDVMLENMVGQRVFVNQLRSRLLLFAKFAAEKQALFDVFLKQGFSGERILTGMPSTVPHAYTSVLGDE